MIYLDNSATSFPKAPGVAEAVFDHLNFKSANSGRASYRAAQDSSRIIFDTREALASLFGVKDSSFVIFTANATESLNTVIFGLVRNNNKVLTSEMEHNSVMRPLRYLEKRGMISLQKFRSFPDGSPDMDDYMNKLGASPDIVISS